MEEDSEPPDCRYELICNWYKPDCYELSCWRARFLNDVIKEGTLEKLANENNSKNKIQDT